VKTASDGTSNTIMVVKVLGLRLGPQQAAALAVV